MNLRVRAVVLAAGKGTRMRSSRPKVLHELCGRPMLWYVLRALRDAGIAEVAVITNADVLPHVDAIARDAGQHAADAVLQEPQLGTGHAMQVALAHLPPNSGARLLVLNGDMPLIEAELVTRTLSAACALALVTARMPLPSAYGRVVRDGERIERVVEAKDATQDELALEEMNAGLYAFDETTLRRTIAALRPDNAQGEYYLTDTIGAFVRAGESVLPVDAGDHRNVLGVNDRVELAAAATALRRRLCEEHMRAGVTIRDPATTYLEPDLTLAEDVTLLPNTSIGGRSRIGAHSEIGPNTRLRDAQVGEHAVVSDSVVVDSTLGDFALVGPWAHVRGNSTIGTGGRIGNFVEVKRSDLAPGVKAAHLSYVGDATVGERCNIGAGTITCNFDGTKKHRTTIGKDAFIGSNSSLVAPLDIGDGAATGAGAVVIRDVADGERVVGNPARVLPKKA
ncbi:MAG: bifunctional UDP-N-acetylglucosamine diphosphorylase/glucosamine-1-phosphate N-acetyltransferase GlmU [Candidatus Eremiobacteraeota bacterium]|nr:bifunctional UDP-N-acetylglucosamine diphosphorylase/glucosamine-1-phosphate N-acetyltransferase GlmU [Candidatus Eremiobacteraeota bacterium]MBC5802607.1 bifunctional UDP-N-acetylglucosamine diphosphorylase/glucosamine-1-phosphate N-acetyltransferase GlmU [Candidatus Eremiobacteraeota bacterium]MBC5822684.1 bifunctional UDP-N-acetylglucosamine diphosphorylase/glucosamine-1-phosphate N-acetyltransferase GlmU [Candidatus Eremiobacteraeota bacterium]